MKSEGFTLERAQQDDVIARSQKRHHRRNARAGGRRQLHSVPLTEDGVPAATPGAPPVSRVVFVSEASRARFPWLPARVISGSVWRGPEFERVRVDEAGRAELWRCRVASGR